MMLFLNTHLSRQDSAVIHDVIEQRLYSLYPTAHVLIITATNNFSYMPKSINSEIINLPKNASY